MDVNRREKQQLHTSTRYEDIASIGMEEQKIAFICSLRELQLVRFGSRLNAMFSNVLEFRHGRILLSNFFDTLANAIRDSFRRSSGSSPVWTTAQLS
jgi:hypothetical protein